jgi:hypothetical protein
MTYLFTAHSNPRKNIGACRLPRHFSSDRRTLLSSADPQPRLSDLDRRVLCTVAALAESQGGLHQDHEGGG